MVRKPEANSGFATSSMPQTSVSPASRNFRMPSPTLPAWKAQTSRTHASHHDQESQEQRDRKAGDHRRHHGENPEDDGDDAEGGHAFAVDRSAMVNSWVLLLVIGRGYEPAPS